MTISETDELIELGHIHGLYGVRGELKVYSHTDPHDQILHYHTWLIQRHNTWQEYVIEAGKRSGKSVVVKLEGVDDREDSRRYLGAKVAIRRADLPALPAGEYYQFELLGFAVMNQHDEVLGTLHSFIETGSHDVMEVVAGRTRELIPYTPGIHVVEIQAVEKTIRVNWDSPD
jgi:16S rRNA processing protein RimM